MEISNISIEEHLLIKYYLKAFGIAKYPKHDVELLQRFMHFLIKKTSGSCIRKDNILN